MQSQNSFQTCISRKSQSATLTQIYVGGCEATSDKHHLISQTPGHSKKKRRKKQTTQTETFSIAENIATNAVTLVTCWSVLSLFCLYSSYHQLGNNSAHFSLSDGHHPLLVNCYLPTIYTCQSMYKPLRITHSAEPYLGDYFSWV